MSIFQYITYGLSIAMVVGAIYYQSEISKLNYAIDSLKKDVIISEVNGQRLRKSIHAQNKEIHSQSVELDKNKAMLEEWKNKPAELRYKVIYKNIPTYIDTKEESCENTEIIIDAVRSIDFSSL